MGNGNAHGRAGTQSLRAGAPDPEPGLPSPSLPAFAAVSMVTTFRDFKRTAWTDEPLFKKIALQIN